MASEYFQRCLDQLVELASTPGWKEYTWDKAQKMAKDQSGLWAGIDQALKVEMLKKKQP